jgi:DNA-nicking Smr family endonuclease
MSKRPLKPDEKRAWARVAKTVRARSGQTPPEMPALENILPQPTQIHSTPTHGVVGKKTDKPAPRPPVKAPIQNRGKERRIRRGQAAIGATLDLHGHTQDSAHNLLVRFLGRQRTSGTACVLVITGKGRAGTGILRKRLIDWLGTAEARSLVSGYAQAHRKHGGSGAWYVFLRKQQTDDR